ncbi:MAG: chloride channel protein [Acidobacteria bacterium]|nr:chloride channel protein [Acidobacteriota bacterium]
MSGPATRFERRLSEPQRFLLLAVLIGVATGLLVVCFHTAIELLAWFTEDRAASTALRVLVPAFGAAAAALMVRYLVPAAAGSGIVQTKSAIYVSNGHIPASAVPGKFVACVLSIGTGTPLGPEDPSLMMGAGIASSLGRTFELSRRSMRLVAPTGAAAGIAAAFNTPITAVLFVMEEVVAAWDAAVLGSIVLAAVSAVVVTRLFLGDAPLFRVPELAASVDVEQALAFALIGVASGVFAAVYVKGIAAVRRRVSLHSRLVPPGLAPFVAGAAAGTMGLWLPEVLGPGYRAMDAALHSQYPWTVMALLGATKLVVAALAFGSGAPGGLFAPTLFVGVMLGGTVGSLGPEVLPAFDAPTVTFVLAGISGVFAGVFRAPMTAVFMVFELSGSSAVIVPAMITGTLGFLVARALHHRSLLDLVAEDEGALLPSARQLREEEPLRIEQALGRSPFVVVPIGASRASVRAAVSASGARVVLAVADGTWWGMRADVLDAGLDDARAADAGDEPIAAHPSLRLLDAAHLDEPLDVALRRLSGQEFVPIVSRLDPARLDGVVTLGDVHAAYGIGTRPGTGAAPTTGAR